VLDLYASFDSDELESAKRFYPRWTGRRDKVSVNLSIQGSVYPSLDRCSQHGIPVYVFRLASFTGSLQKELNAVPEERRHQRMCVSSHFQPPTPHADVPTASASGSLCPDLPSPSVLLSPVLLPRPHPPKVPPRPRLNHLYHLSPQRLRSLTLAVSPLV
jgi:hypothetical protein